MVKNYDPATPDEPGPARPSVPCTDCGTETPTGQARRTFEQFDVPLCQACAARWDEEIKAGRIPHGPTEKWDPSQATNYEVYQNDHKLGRIWQAPDVLPLPPGSIGQGFHRPKPGGACFQLFRMPGDAPVPGTLEYYEEEIRRQEAARATEEPEAKPEPEQADNPSISQLEAVTEATWVATQAALEAMQAQVQAVQKAAQAAIMIMRTESFQVTSAAHEFLEALAGYIEDPKAPADQPGEAPEPPQAQVAEQ